MQERQYRRFLSHHIRLMLSFRRDMPVDLYTLLI